MEIWQMRYFIQVYNDKSFSKAAKKLYISQQGLSKTIKNLEDELNVPLLDRSVKGVRPTEYGDILYEKSRNIINEYEHMIDSICKKAKMKKGTIIIGMSNILHSDFLSHICTFQEEYPDIKLELIELGTLACEKYMDKNLVDICFAAKLDNINYEFLPVVVYDMIILVNKQNPISQNTSLKLEDLKNEKFIMLAPDYKIRQLTTESCKQAGFDPDIVFTTSQLDFIIELVNLNKGIAVLPVLHSLKATKMSNNIKVVHFHESPFKVEVGFLFNRYKRLNYITDILINYSMSYIESKKLFDKHVKVE